MIPKFNWQYCAARPLAILLFAIIFISTRAQTKVSGEQGDSIWVKAKSPYSISGSITVAAGKTLIIQPGVEVQFPLSANAVNSSLTIKGTLRAVGKADTLIKFTGGSLTNICCGQFTQRGPVIIDASSVNSVLQYITVDGLGYSLETDTLAAIIVRSSSCTIANCTIKNIKESALRLDKANPVISNNNFSANDLEDIVLDMDNLPNVSGNNALKIGLLSASMASDAILTAKNIYYNLLGPLTIPGGRKLSIQPGTTLIFPQTTNAARSSLTIKGSLQAVGKPDSLIKFTGGTLTAICCGQFNQRGPVILDTSSANSVLQYIAINGLGNSLNTLNGAAVIIRSSDCIFQNNTVTSTGGSGIMIPLAGIVPVISSNNFTGNTNADIYSSASSVSKITSNTKAIIYLPAGDTIKRNITWPYPGDSARYALAGALTIAANDTLTLTPGITVDFNTNVSNLTVNGTLIAAGSFQNRIKFSNFNTAGTYGGTVNFSNASKGSVLRSVDISLLGSSTSPSLGTALNISTGSISVNDISVNGSQKTGITINNASPTIATASFSKNAVAVLSTSGRGVFTNCDFNNNGFGIRNTSAVISDTIDARNNWWGAASGPKAGSNPAGTGDSVSTRVLYIPAQGLSSLNMLINPGAESPLGAEWTVVSAGTNCAPVSGWRVPGGQSSYPAANSGTYYFTPGCGPGANSTFEIYQNVNIAGNANAIDAGRYQLNFTGYLRCFAQNPSDVATITIEYRDAANNLLSPFYSSGATSYTTGWTPYSATMMAPSGARSVRVRLIGVQKNGNAVDAYFDDLSLTASTDNSKQSQTITFPALPDKVYGDSAFKLKASASSALPVKFKIISGPAVISNDTLVITGAGQIAVEADQDGNNLFNPAQPASQTFNVSKASQQIVFTALLDSSYVKGTRYILGASSSTGLPVQLSVVSGAGLLAGDTLSFTGAGQITVKALQPGNQNYDPASQQKIFCVSAIAPDSINGFTNACRGVQPYSISALTGVKYSWKISEGGSLSVSSGSAVSVNWTQLGVHLLTVTASNDCDTISFSKSITVNIIAGNPPGVTGNLFPGDGLIAGQVPFAVSWQPGSGATLYDVYVWPDGSAQPSSAAITNVPGITSTITRSQLPGFASGKKYDWSVTAKNGCGATPGPVQSFSIGGLPNLTVNAVGVADTIFSGTRIDLSATIVNNGGAATGSGQWAEEFWLSADTILEQFTDTFLGSAGNKNALAAGQGYTTHLSAQLPVNFVGPYNIIVRTNHSESSMTESNPDDNIKAKSFYIKVTPPPDLVVDTVLYRGDAFSGDSLPVNYTVSNRGQNATPTALWQDNIYISPSPVFNSSEAILLKSVDHNGILDPGDQYNGAVTVVLPTKVFGGYFIHVFTDAENKIYEYLYDNNNVTAGNPLNIILTAPPDLVVSQLNAPKTAAGGETIAIDYTVLNQGANKPGTQEQEWSDVLFLSTDTNFETGATLASVHETTQQPVLGNGNSYHRSINVTIPASFTGNLYLTEYTDHNRQVFEYLKEGNNYRQIPITVVNPDLVVTNASFTGDASTGNIIDVSWTVKNNGPGKVLPVQKTDALYLSSSAVFSKAGSTLLGQVNYNNAIDSGGASLLYLSARLPQNMTGSLYLFIITDAPNSIAEADETNNTSAAIPISVGRSPAPDLVIDSFTLSSPLMKAGLNYALHYSVSNKGTGNVVGKSWVDRIYRSADAVFDPSRATLVKEITQQRTMMPGDAYQETDSVGTDLAAFSGTDTLQFYYFVVTDASNIIFEDNGEGNNTSAGIHATVSHDPFPDLVVTAATGLDSLHSGARTSIQGVIVNRGGTAGIANAWYDAILFSKDTIPSQDDIVAYTKVASQPFNFGNSYAVNFNFKVPDGLSGQYSMLLVSDYTRINPDKDRSNNSKAVRVKVGTDTAQSISVHISLTPSPDLVATSFSAPASAYAGQPVLLKFSITNQGAVKTSQPGWKDNIYLSSDAIVDQADLLLQTYTRNGALEVNGTYSDSLLVFLPATAKGNLYLLYKADGNNTVYENNAENNNVGAALIFIQPLQLSDLVVTAVTTPPQALVNDLIPVSWHLGNNGLNPAAGYLHQSVYYSEDTVLDKDDVLLFDSTAKINIATGADSLFTQAVRLNGVAGTGHIIITADSKSQMPESDEFNNTGYSIQPIHIGVTDLPMNMVMPATLSNNTGLYYKIDISDSLEGKTLLVSLKGDSTNAANEFYLRLGALPSRINFDYEYSDPLRGSQEIVIPALAKGTYYIMAYGASSKKPVQHISLYASIIDFAVRSVNAKQGGNGGNVTVQITGARFEAGMTASLANAGSGTIVAQQVKLTSSTSLYASFNLAGAPVGVYDLILTKTNNDKASLPAGFKVVSSAPVSSTGSNGGTGFYCYLKADKDDGLSTEVDYPGQARVGHPFPMTIIYGNNSDNDIPIPQILLNSLDKAPLGFDAVFANLLTQLPLVLKELNGPDNVLRPGFSGTLKVFSAVPSTTAPARYELIQY